MEIGNKFPVMVPEINVFVALGRGGSDKDTVHLAVLTPAGDVLVFCIAPVMWINNTAVLCDTAQRHFPYARHVQAAIASRVARVGGTGNQHKNSWGVKCAACFTMATYGKLDNNGFLFASDQGGLYVTKFTVGT